MLIQRGRFTINNMTEIDTISSSDDGIKKVIDLNYMGEFEFEGNAIPFSRMYIEYHREEYEFIPLNVYSKNGEQLFIFISREELKDRPDNYLELLVDYVDLRQYSFYEYINYPEKANTNFWWDIGSHFMLFFGEEKKKIIEYFIDSCYKRDGSKEEIKQKVLKAGYRFD